MKNKQVFTAVPSPQTKMFMDADSQLAELEQQLEAAFAEVKWLMAAVATQRKKTAALFNTARGVNG